MERFLTDNSASMRFARTVVQGILAALIVFVPEAMGMLDLQPSVAALLTAAIMAVLSPAMAMLKASDTIEADDAPELYADEEDYDDDAEDEEDAE